VRLGALRALAPGPEGDTPKTTHSRPYEKITPLRSGGGGNDIQPWCSKEDFAIFWKLISMARRSARKMVNPIAKGGLEKQFHYEGR